MIEAVPVDDGVGALSRSEQAAERRRSFLEWLLAIGLAILAALVIKTFLIQAFVIPSSSMEPTLVPSDRVLVSKLNYQVGEIRRGDVLVFQNPDWREGDPKQLIKRVVGLPGDVIEGADGGVVINGVLLDEPYLDVGSDRSTTDFFDQQVVPDGTVFVMGDNRRNSKDSRIFGPVDQDDIVGQAFFRIWRPNRIGRL